MGVRFHPLSLGGNHSLLIVDYRYVHDHQVEIEKWCMDSFGYCDRTGMIISFESEDHLNWFLLKWG